MTLERLVAEQRGLRDDLAIQMVIHMLNALYFLYEANILHRFVISQSVSCIQYPQLCFRDIKPENILVQKHADGEMVFKLTDFGFAKFVSFSV